MQRKPFGGMREPLEDGTAVLHLPAFSPPVTRFGKLSWKYCGPKTASLAGQKGQAIEGELSEVVPTTSGQRRQCQRLTSAKLFGRPGAGVRNLGVTAKAPVDPIVHVPRVACGTLGAQRDFVPRRLAIPSLRSPVFARPLGKSPSNMGQVGLVPVKNQNRPAERSFINEAAQLSPELRPCVRLAIAIDVPAQMQSGVPLRI